MGASCLGGSTTTKSASVARVAVRTDFANGKHLYVYEMATDAAQRSKGFGKQLMDAVEVWAKQQGCAKVILYSGLQREGAHRFWTHKMGYGHRGGDMNTPAPRSEVNSGYFTASPQAARTCPSKWE